MGVESTGRLFSPHLMDRPTAYDLYEALGEDACLFGYSGAFPDEHTARLIELGAAVLDSQGSKASERGRLSYVMVEAYQNVVRHRARLSPEIEAREGRSHFLLRCGPDGQTVATLNPVATDKAKDLQEVLGFLKGRTSAELKDLFRDGIQRTHSPERRGAGLGLIEMMRRSGATPNWQRRDAIPGHTMFSLAWSPGGPDTTAGLDLMERQRTSLEALGAWIGYSGYRTPEVMEALGRMVEMEPGFTGQGTQGMAALDRALAAIGSEADARTPVTIVLGNGPAGTWMRIGTVVKDGDAALKRITAEHGADAVRTAPVPTGTWVEVTLPPQDR